MKKDLEKILEFIFKLALIFAIVYLIATNKDGWGWLLFVLFVIATQ